MNITNGKTYNTANGGSVRIIADDRKSSNGKHWVGLYDGENGEWLVTYDADGMAYVFDTPKPELSLKPEISKWWVLTYTTLGNRTKAEIWSADTNNRERVEKYIANFHLENAKLTLVEQ
jgi:hypothetical protein